MSDVTRSAGVVIALLGAESTGKSTLAAELVRRLATKGIDAVLVPEYLRTYCETHTRTPMAHDQAGIAAEQTRQIEAAASRHAVVVADTTALMVAVYSELVFGDKALYAQAERDHDRVAMTLLMALDLPWVNDGLQRDGPHVREPVDALVRRALERTGATFAVVSGQGEARIEQAMSIVQHVLDEPDRLARALAGPRWRWFCENCGDGECEQHAAGVDDRSPTAR